MTTTTIRRIKTDSDLESVKDLCWQFRDWLAERYVEHPDVVDDYYDPKSYSDLLSNLSLIHAPPLGCILLASTGETDVGCAMIQKLDDGICEMKRMFVSVQGRGHGVGSALVLACIDESRTMGYHTMRLDTGHPQREAYALYKKHGFLDRSPYYDAPPKIRPILHFLERSL